MRKEELDEGREGGLRRYRIIAPLLEEGLAECEKRNLYLELALILSSSWLEVHKFLSG